MIKKYFDLKKVVSVTGEYTYRNFTVFDIINLKGEKQLTKTLPFLVEEAEAAEKAGIDTMNIRYTPERPEIAKNLRKAAPNTFMSFSMPTTAATSESEALKLSYDAMAIGADSILCGTWSLKFINAVSNAGIPTEGHLGLVPRRSTWTGGLRAVGKTINQAKKIYDDLKTLENVGAWAVEIEVVPSDILSILSPNTSLVTSSIGGGRGDIQYLFAEDILGDSPGPFPRHSKQYTDLYSMRCKMQEMRILAFNKFIKEVKTEQFPSEEYEVNVEKKVKTELIDYIENN